MPTMLRRRIESMYLSSIQKDPVKARVALPAADPPDHAIDDDRVADL
ncbi:hypothetical protein [Methylobacterium fujisawaense]